jgi:mitochondrial intermediate peptidase
MHRLAPTALRTGRLWTASSSPSHPGQFALPGLHAPSDWSRIATQCLQRCEVAADAIRGRRASPSAETLQLFDDLSDDICTVLDAAELCRNVHPNPEFARAADEAYGTVSRMTVGLNADRALYEPLQCLRESSVPLSDEQRTMLSSIQLDFERGGINLPASERNRVAELQNRANALGAQFVSNAASATAFVRADLSKLRGLPGHVLRRMPRAHHSLQHVLIPAGDPVIAPLVMKSVDDSDIRRQLFLAENSRCAGVNLPVLDELLTSRHELATLLGAEGYAHLMFHGRLASSPDKVEAFLHRLASLLQPAAERESRTVLSHKQNSSRLDAWDRSYYMGIAKADAFEIDAGRIAEYLPVSACLRGMATVMKKVFGVSMTAVSRDDCHSELWHEDVVKMELRHEEDGVLGHAFLDLYPRDRKYGHAAHFCLRCGRDRGDGSGYQTPVVALVCNISRSADGAPPLLSFSEYETLWHEWGHAMHSLLSRTRYQHLSGTRVATDLVEIPSHVFELFAWDPRVLSATAAHHRTGDPMPTRYIRALCASRHQFVASELQTQVLYACLDLEYHGARPPVGRTTEAAAVLQNKLTNVAHVDGTAPQAAFQHFVGYGAGYYSCTLCVHVCVQRRARTRSPHTLTVRFLRSRHLCAHPLVANLGAAVRGGPLRSRVRRQDAEEHAFVRCRAGAEEDPGRRVGGGAAVV